MPRVSTYLNFPRSTEAAFVFYKSVFGGEFASPIMRFDDVPAGPGQPPLAEGGKVEMPLEEMFWGGYFGTLVDRFGMHWMFNRASKT